MNSHGQDEHRVVWSVVGTDIGPLLLAATDDGLVNVVFHATDAVRDRALERLAARLGTEPVEAPASPLLAEAIRQVGAYFAGERRDFELPLDWSLISGFNRQVLRELESGVAYGAVVGYGDLARRVGQPGAAQAVGVAMGSNPLPVVVPCHRVVESDGGIGGFGADWRRSGGCWRWKGCCRNRCSEAETRNADRERRSRTALLKPPLIRRGVAAPVETAGEPPLRAPSRSHTALFTHGLVRTRRGMDTAPVTRARSTASARPVAAYPADACPVVARSASACPARSACSTSGWSR